MRLIVRRVKPTPGSQLALFATYSYHGFDGGMLELEAVAATPRSRMPSGARCGVDSPPTPPGAVLCDGPQHRPLDSAHRWASMTTKTLRRRFFSLAGSDHPLGESPHTADLSQRWPWEAQFDRALARLRALPLPPDGGGGNRPPSGQPNVPAKVRGVPLAAAISP